MQMCNAAKTQSLGFFKTLGEAGLQACPQGGWIRCGSISWADASTNEGDSDPSEVEEGLHANTTRGKHAAEGRAKFADGRAIEVGMRSKLGLVKLRWQIV